ncbi:hypothetical protein STSO111631_05500 [Stackebrandtia soli]
MECNVAFSRIAPTFLFNRGADSLTRRQLSIVRKGWMPIGTGWLLRAMRRRTRHMPFDARDVIGWEANVNGWLVPDADLPNSDLPEALAVRSVAYLSAILAAFERRSTGGVMVGMASVAPFLGTGRHTASTTFWLDRPGERPYVEAVSAFEGQAVCLMRSH